MRGQRRTKVAAVLVLATAASGGIAGFAAGVVWIAARVPALGPRVALAVGVAALALDLLYVLSGRPRPLSVRRQVPREWGRLLSGTIAAALYGARLGTGPLTILVTWAWWAAAILGASNGPWWSAGVGIVFGAVRAAAIVTAAVGAGPQRSASLGRVELRAWAALSLAILVATAVVQLV